MRYTLRVVVAVQVITEDDFAFCNRGELDEDLLKGAVLDRLVPHPDDSTTIGVGAKMTALVTDVELTGSMSN